MYRQSSFDSTGSDDCGQDNISVVSESFNQEESKRKNDKSKKTLCGYLLKKSKEGLWQKRFFELNGNFLTYYKSKKMNKLLAALNMSSVGQISLVGHINDDLGNGVVFQLELKDRSYILRTKDIEDAERWMQGLTKARDLALESTIPEEPDENTSINLTNNNNNKDNNKDSNNNNIAETIDEEDDDDNDEKPLHSPQIEKSEGPTQDWEKKKDSCCIIL